TAAFDRTKLLPGRAREGAGQGLDIVAAAGRIDAAIEARLVAQDRLGVEREPPTECAAATEPVDLGPLRAAQPIEGRRRDRVGAPERSGEGPDGPAQEVDPRRVPGPRPLRARRVDP